MKDLLNYLYVRGVVAFIAVFRLPGLNSPRIYALWAWGPLQRWMEHFSRCRAYEVYRIARARCPAYRSFLAHERVPILSQVSQFDTLPYTDKANYVSRFSIEERCLQGRLPTRGVVIDESSGSSGTPNNWVRGAEERRSVRQLIQHAYSFRFGSEPLIVINCFALGPWATGMNVSMALVDVAILKSVGPDKSKLENTLKVFGTGYRYLLAGYPPFFKDWLSSTTLELGGFEIHLVVGGEGISEGLRDFFLRRVSSVHSSYGASDLEINIGAETDFTIQLRKLCLANSALSVELFGREDAPMIFQYNPVDYFIERSKEGELVTTVLRLENAAPRVRYNIHDLGGVVPFRAVARLLSKHRIEASTLGRLVPKLPILYLFGRNDLSVPFYGAKIFATDFDRVLNEHETLREAYFGFRFMVTEDAALEKTLVIDLEHSARAGIKRPSDSELSSILYAALQAVNQDFREVSRMFSSRQVVVHQHPYCTGPFAERDIRLKNRYLGTPSR